MKIKSTLVYSRCFNPRKREGHAKAVHRKNAGVLQTMVRDRNLNENPGFPDKFRNFMVSRFRSYHQTMSVTFANAMESREIELDLTI